MRKHFTRLLVLTAAVGTIGGTALAASAASASTARPAVTGPVITTKNAAGYELSKRDFRFITSTIRVPDWPSNVLYPQAYIQLAEGSLNNLLSPTGDEYVRAGIEPCDLLAILSGSHCAIGDKWVAFVSVYNSSLNAPIWQHYVDLAGVQEGDGVNFSVFYDQAGNELHFTITPPITSGPETFYKTNAHGPIFTDADAIDDWLSTTGQPVPLPPGFNPIQINGFLQGAATTYSGLKGSFTSSGWTTSQVVATSNGLPFPQGTVRVQPSVLGSDGLSANGAVRPGDMFTESLVG